MIKFALGCEKDHEFDGWFPSNDEFARLRDKGLVDCPVCGSTKIQKLLMAPSVKTTKGKTPVVVPMSEGSTPPPAAASNIPPAGGQIMATKPNLPEMPAEIQKEVAQQIREIRKKIVENAENVGEKFSEEARKMHYGEKEQRGIYGTSSLEEAAELIEEGIEIVPLPALPEDKN